MKLHNKTYDAVIPFGHTCAAAMYSSERGFRRCSLPFDWIGSGLAGIKALAGYVLNGFEGYMAPEQLVHWDPFKNIPPDAYHDPYWNPGTQLIFVHDFRKGIPMAEESVAVKERYNRRIRRLYEILESPAKKLLFCWAYDEHPSSETLIEVACAMRKRFPQGEIDLLFMESVKDFQGLEQISVAPGITLVRGYFYNIAKGVTMGDCELSNRVLKQVSVRGSRKELVRRAFRRLLFKLRAALEFDREKRHQLRKKIRDGHWGQ